MRDFFLHLLIARNDWSSVFSYCSNRHPVTGRFIFRYHSRLPMFCAEQTSVSLASPLHFFRLYNTIKHSLFPRSVRINLLPRLSNTQFENKTNTYLFFPNLHSIQHIAVNVANFPELSHKIAYKRHNYYNCIIKQ